MALSEIISRDLTQAMKSGDKRRLETLRTIRAQIIEFEKRGEGSAMSDEQELSILLAAAKKRKEAIELYEKGGREDLVAQEREELEIINAYLPAQMGDEEILAVIRRHIAETGAAGAKDFGKVMPRVMKELKGKADGKKIQELVKAILG